MLPPPAALEMGAHPFYSLPSLSNLGLGSAGPQQRVSGFNIPSINAGNDSGHSVTKTETGPELRRLSSVGMNHKPSLLPPPAPMNNEQPAALAPPAMPAGVPNRTATTNVYRTLNVRDALSYLDQVKIQFYSQADVYNNFLDIMKDFKSQNIDTSEVIDRVSTLFKGHPNLIQGFNTFLPAGYKIECSLDPSDPNPIRVTTPTGTTKRPNMNATYGQWSSGAGDTNGQQDSQANQQALSSAHQAAHQLQALQQPPFGSDPNGGQIEFNHAISYVNKIKTRFANQPDIYKHFLEILQTYQREQKPISEVYEQVTVLFANSPDLLDDFKQFLPDTSNQPTAQPPYLPPDSANGANGSQLPPVGNFHQSSAPGMSPGEVGSFHQPMFQDEFRKRKSIDQRNDPRAQYEAGPYENHYNAEAQYSSLRSKPLPVQNKNGAMIPKAVNPALVPGVPEPVPPSHTPKSSSLLEELSFFDKVKKAIGNKQTYNEFLKILNLFSQDIIDKETLVERVDSFIGENHPDLFNWFKMFVGYEDKPQRIENITFKKHQLELSLCKAFGPSYRQLPKSETYMPCSGRDEMCWEVLNDEWVGHPTWASEDSGFIAHRKNQYEEILFKIEEERLEFDYHMEANLRTIQTLETIANRIANMTPEQKASFKLPEDLGHTSSTIYKKVIRKIYDKDRGFEVIDALHENPAIAVPVVLKRLKQKDEEWKRSHREWNKVWREMEQKVFYKSLDHLGLTFKQADKKLLTAKQLVSEISTVKVEQQNKRLHPLTPKPQEQLKYKFDEPAVLLDILKLVTAFIKSSNYSVNDREKLSYFFQSFLTLFFKLPKETISAAANEKAYAKAEESEPLAESQGSNPKKHHRDTDLLRDVLKKQSRAKKDDATESPSPVVSDSDEPDVAHEADRSSELWIKTLPRGDEPSTSEQQGPEKRDKFNLFCNTTIYVFFRHLRTLYERLVEIKAMNKAVGEEIRSRKLPQFAKDLNLSSHQLEDMGVEIKGDKDCYKQVLDLAERLIEGEVEHQWYEESLRQAYRNRAYKMYTVDKLVQSMVKHMHTIVSDSRTSEMIVLFEADRAQPTSTAKDQILYRIKVRSLMSTDENMFKIALRESDSSVSIQFVSLDDLTINDQQSAEEKYNYYVTSYVMSYPTEGVPASKLNLPFSKSFIENIEEEDCDGVARSGLKVSVCENSFRLFFEADSHDEYTANTVFNKKPEETLKKERLEGLKSLLDNEEIGWKSSLDERTDPKGLDERANILISKGTSAYLESENLITTKSVQESAPEVDMEDASVPAASEETSLETKQPAVDGEADATILHEQNDTTVQQDANDTTTEETTIHQEDHTMIANQDE